MKCAKANAQPELGGERAAVVGRAEQPDLRRGIDLGCSRTRLNGWSSGRLPWKCSRSCQTCCGKSRASGSMPPPTACAVTLAAAGRAADAEVDAAGIERFQHAEGLGDAKRAVVGSSTPPVPDAQALRLRAQARQQHFGAGIGERGDGMVLGEPVAVIAELVGAPRERERLLDRPPRAEAADHRRLIEHRETHRQHAKCVAGATTLRNAMRRRGISKCG